MIDDPNAIPGWYGKVPGLGDFASRRLPAEFIRPWDMWLQEVLQATRGSLGDEWLECYLTMPIWRFALLPGLVGESGWAGVLMPSVDRVGRQFPLTLAAAASSNVALAHAVFESGSWFAGLEDVALGMLDPARTPDDLDRALAACTVTFPEPPEPDGMRGSMRRLPSAEAFESVAKGEALQAWARALAFRTLWWTRGRIDADPLMVVSAELPTAEEFEGLLRSRVSPVSLSAPPRGVA